jgi:hypothetical protein
MPHIYLIDSTDYVISNEADKAAARYKELRGKDAISISKFKDSDYVVISDTTYTITPAIGTALAETDGAKVYPSSAFTVAENSEVVVTAVDSGEEVGNYEFSEWQDGSGNTLSTDNPYTVTVDATKSVVAIFTEIE